MADIRLSPEAIADALSKLNTEQLAKVKLAAAASGIGGSDKFRLNANGSITLTLDIPVDTVQYYRGLWEEAHCRTNEEIREYIMPMIMDAINGAPFASFAQEAAPPAQTATIPSGTAATK